MNCRSQLLMTKKPRLCAVALSYGYMFTRKFFCEFYFNVFRIVKFNSKNFLFKFRVKYGTFSRFFGSSWGSRFRLPWANRRCFVISSCAHATDSMRALSNLRTSQKGLFSVCKNLGLPLKLKIKKLENFDHQGPHPFG